MELLEYLIQLRGGAAAAAEIRGLAGEMTDLATAQAKVATSGDAAAASSAKMGGVLGLAGKATAGIGLALVGVGLEAVKASNSFNHEMLRIRTDAGASTAELQRMKAAVLDLASSGQSMGQGPMALAQGLYHLESLGIRGTRAIQALKLASQEAAISGASLEDTTSALGAAFFVGVKGAGDLQHVMAVLNATVGSGNMRFGQLIEGLGTGVLGAFKVAHLSIQDMSAAIAVLTDDGYHASSAAAQLGTALHFLYDPGTKAEKALEAIHLSGARLAADLMKPQGLLAAMKDLHAHMAGLGTVGQEQMLGEILPGGRGRVLLNLFEQTGRLQGKYGQEARILGSFRSSVALQQKDPTTQLHEATARMQADLVRLGNVLTPIVVPALTAVVDAGAQLLEWLSKVPAALGTVIGLFSGGGKALGGFGSIVSQSFHDVASVASSMWSDLVKAFNGIAGAAKQVFTRSLVADLKTIGSAIVEWTSTLFSFFGKIVHLALPGLVDGFKGAFDIIKGIVQIFAGLLTLDFGKMWSGIENIFSGAWKIIEGIIVAATAPVRALAATLWDGLKSGLASVILWIEQRINDLIGAYNSTIGELAGSITPIDTTSTAEAAGMINGPHGYVPAGGPKPTRTHSHTSAGTRRSFEHAVRVPAAVNAGGLEAHVTSILNVDGREFARVYRREMIKAMAAGA